MGGMAGRDVIRLTAVAASLLLAGCAATSAPAHTLAPVLTATNSRTAVGVAEDLSSAMARPTWAGSVRLTSVGPATPVSASVAANVLGPTENAADIATLGFRQAAALQMRAQAHGSAVGTVGLQIVQFRSATQSQRFLERLRPSGARSVTGLARRSAWVGAVSNCSIDQCQLQFMLSSRSWAVMGGVLGKTDPSGVITLADQLGQSLYGSLTRG